jgi:N-acetylglucosaminyldiphosphoundecaprenol N-acetyl-beta-D-mannosaminyltransferase
MRPRVALFGCEVDALTLDETVERVAEIVASGIPTQHVALNAQGVVAMQDDSKLREIVRRSGLVTADGQAFVWAARFLGRRIPERVAGPDLFVRLVSLAEALGYPIYVLGARQSVLEKACETLQRDHPDLVIAGSCHGFFAESETERIVDDIRKSQAMLLFVALPMPLREYWVAENLENLNVPFCMALGGGLDIIAGIVRRAPVWMRRAGLEWLFRLIQEPKKLWRRYLIGNMEFAWLVAKERFRSRTGE